MPASTTGALAIDVLYKASLDCSAEDALDRLARDYPVFNESLLIFLPKKAVGQTEQRKSSPPTCCALRAQTEHWWCGQPQLPHEPASSTRMPVAARRLHEEVNRATKG